jgi:hypothetical protein
VTSPRTGSLPEDFDFRVGPQTDKHEFPTLDQSTSLGICGDLPDLLSLPVVSGRCDRQLRWRLVFAGETLSHAGAVQRSEMENAERPDAGAGELQQRADTGSQFRGFVFSHNVIFSVHASSIAHSVERDQGAEEQGLGVRVHNFHHWARVGNPFADSCEFGSEARGVG